MLDCIQALASFIPVFNRVSKSAPDELALDVLELDPIAAPNSSLKISFDGEVDLELVPVAAPNIWLKRSFEEDELDLELDPIAAPNSSLKMSFDDELDLELDPIAAPNNSLKRSFEELDFELLEDICSPAFINSLMTSSFDALAPNFCIANLTPTLNN